MSTESEVQAALAMLPTQRSAELERIAEELFAAAYDELVNDDSNDDLTVDDIREYVMALGAAIEATRANSSIDLVAGWLETAAKNAAVIAAAPPGATFTWNTQLDDRVRDTHEPMHGVTVASGKPFMVGGVALQYPGQPIGPPEVWINCRCGLTVGAGVVTAASDPPRGAVAVATLADPESVAVEGGDPADELHVTLGYYGHAEEAPEQLREALTAWIEATSFDPFDAKVTGTAKMGDDDPPATTYLLEHPNFTALHDSLNDVARPAGDHPHFTPHVTIGYGVEPPENVPESVGIDGVQLWWAGERIGGNMTAAISEEPWSKYSASDYSIEQWRRACLITMPGGDPQSKSTYKVPVLTPSGAVSRAGVHAAAAALAGARGGVNAPAEQKAKAKSRLRGLYSKLGDEPPDSLKADGEELVAAPGTRDGPGWLTHPRDTQRLRTYWTRGKGAAKIRWGVPGDFNRCRKQLGKYIKNKHYLDGTCANLHKVAINLWPGQEGGRRGRHAAGELADYLDGLPLDIDTEQLREIAAAFAQCDCMEDDMEPPIELFQDPQLQGPTPLTVRAAGDFNEVSGHLATWDTCHVGFGEKNCVTAPKSAHDYAYFRTGEVMTSAGPVPVGHITAGTGHATADASPTETVRHYDDTGTVVADVAAGEDEFGIWVHGIERPGISQEQGHALRAGAPSGDWRRIGGNLELVGALIVNVPGFPIPRLELAASAADPEVLLALTAAAIVTVDPNAIDYQLVAVSVVNEQERRIAAGMRAVRVAQLTASIREQRVARLHEKVGA